MPAALAPAALMGAIIGSFLNVVAWRLPRGESLVTPGSHCPGCDAPVKPYDNVPILSWLLLRGKCRSCSTRISARYPVVELLTAALFAGVVAANADDTARMVLGLLLVGVMVPIAIIDFETRRIPNAITGPAAVAAIVLGTALDPGGEPERLIAGLAAGLFFFIPAAINPRGMGMGDVKLAALMGLLLGRSVAPAVFLGLIVGTIGGMAIIARKGMTAGRKTTVPFGPFLAVGAIAFAILGDGLMDGYLDRF